MERTPEPEAYEGFNLTPMSGCLLSTEHGARSTD
jgi:hypothetical protein